MSQMHFTVLPQIENALLEIEFHTQSRFPAGRSRFSGRTFSISGRLTKCLSVFVASNVQNLAGLALIPHFDNPTFIWLVIVIYCIRQNLVFQDGGGLDFRQGGIVFQQVGLIL